MNLVTEIPFLCGREALNVFDFACAYKWSDYKHFKQVKTCALTFRFNLLSFFMAIYGAGQVGKSAIAFMQTCGLWQFKLRTCGCGLFLIFVRNSASFIQILKFLSIFVKYLCFYSVKHKKSIYFFEFKFGKNIKFFEIRLTKILSLLFDLIAFFLLTCCFFEFGTTTDFF